MNKKSYLLSPLIILLVLLISILIYNGFLNIESITGKGLKYESMIDKALFDYEFNKLSFVNNVTHYAYLIASDSSTADEFESGIAPLVAAIEYAEEGVNLTMNYAYQDSGDVSLSINEQVSKLVEYPLTSFLGFNFNPSTMSNCLSSHCFELDYYFTNCLELYNEEIVPFNAVNSSVPNYVSGNVQVLIELVHGDYNMTYLFPYNLGLVFIPCS